MKQLWINIAENCSFGIKQQSLDISKYCQKSVLKSSSLQVNLHRILPELCWRVLLVVCELVLGLTWALLKSSVGRYVNLYWVLPELCWKVLLVDMWTCTGSYFLSYFRHLLNMAMATRFKLKLKMHIKQLHVWVKNIPSSLNLFNTVKPVKSKPPWDQFLCWVLIIQVKFFLQ